MTPQAQGSNLHYPDHDKVSILTATVLLAYALSQYVEIPSREISFSIASFFLSFEINVNTVVALLVAGIAASGADWLLRGHPHLENKLTIHHWVLPGMTTLIMGILLNQLESRLIWWIIFGIGAVFLVVVLIAEYIVVDANDPRFMVALVGLTALSFALYLVLLVYLRVGGYRLVFNLPGIILASGLICMRTLYLRLLHADNVTPENINTALLAALTTVILTGEITTILHYWDLTPFAFALSVFAPVYGLTSFFGNLAADQPIKKAIMEPLISTAIIWVAAGWIT